VQKRAFYKRIIMQGLAHSHVRGNRQSTEENALLFPFYAI